MIYLIYINFVYYSRINQNYVTDKYHTYSFFSSMLLAIQIGIIVKYLFELVSCITTKEYEKNIKLIQNISYVLFTINLIFVIIIHITLAFFSTDG